MSELRKAAKAAWMPIESAPRDGTRVIVANKHGVTTAYWGDAQVWDVPWNDATQNLHWVRWECEDYFYSEHLLDELEPTHWMPLPPPPEGFEDADAA